MRERLEANVGTAPAVRPSPLEYATPGTEQRVQFFREGDGATVVIHRPGRRARKAWAETASAAGELIWYAVLASAATFWFSSAWLAALVVVPGAAVIGAGIYGVSWLWHARLARPIVIELTPTELVFANLDESARPRRLGREGLYAIKYVGHATTIFVYRRGHEMWGFHAAEEAGEGERIATFLREAAGLGCNVVDGQAAKTAARAEPRPPGGGAGVAGARRA